MASRPLSNRRPLPAASSFIDSLRAAWSSAAERFAFARAAQALRAAAALCLPVRALIASISGSRDSGTRLGRGLGGRLFGVRPPHPCWNIARAVEHTPNVDIFCRFDIEHYVWKAPERPRAQAR